MTLTKKKVSKKHYPPDTQAAKMLLEAEEEESINDLSEEEIKDKIKKLLIKYKGELNEEDET